ncbi:MAG: DUF2264 domain-containing protein [Microbacterium sp.]
MNESVVGGGRPREVWALAAEHMLDAVEPFRSEDGSGIRLPGRASANGPEVDQFEAFSRTFLLAAMSGDAERLHRYLPGLLRGAGGAWPALRDDGQAMVEVCSIALGLWISRSRLWDGLSRCERDAIASYLVQVRDKESSLGNWLLFRVVVLSFLAEVGEGDFEREVREAFQGLGSIYRGNGWYTDGRGPRDGIFDYYNSWAFHFYPLMWLHLSSDPLAERVQRIRDRASAYNRQLLHFFGADGTPVLQGRSLIYTTAIGASLAAGQLVGVNAAEAGVSRRALRKLLHTSLLRQDLAHVPVAQGWNRPFLPMVPGYSGPGSAYWLAKAFAVLLMSEQHPFWHADEEPLPVESGDFTKALPPTGWLLSGTRSDGVVRLINLGVSRPTKVRDASRWESVDDAWYNRVAYSSATAPWLRENSEREFATEEHMPDNWIGTVHEQYGPAWWEETLQGSVSDAGGVAVTATATPLAGRVIPGRLIRWGARIRGGVEVRFAEVPVRAGETIAMTGYMLPGESLRTAVGGGVATVSAETGISSTVGALTAGGVAGVEQRGESVLGVSSALPSVRWTPSGDSAVFRVGALIMLGAGPIPDLPVIDWGDASVTVVWSDGTRDVVPWLSNHRPL